MSHNQSDQTQPRSRIHWVSVPVEEDDHDEGNDKKQTDGASSAEKGEHANNALSRLFTTGAKSIMPSISRSNSNERAQAHLKSRREALPSELFYDLFFVANLNVFTSAHEISTKQDLDSYIGFFALLWGVWYQVSMFDVRLGSDSVFDRCAKVLQFGVMLGFAIIGSNFNLYEIDFYTSYGQALSLILMANRFVLAVQYFVASRLTTGLPHVKRPTLVVSIAYVITGAIYLGVSFIFPSGSILPFKPSIVWYALTAVESFASGLSHRFGSGLSFKDTHFIERMSLLTLIILGEGVIGLLEAVTIAFNAGPRTGGFYRSFIEGVICGTLILFFLYQLYFDSRPHAHFGRVKSRWWALLHFPLHLALLLCVEGSLHFVSWRVALSATSPYDKQISSYNIVYRLLAAPINNPPFTGSQNSTSYFDQQATLLEDLVNRVTQQYPLGVSDTTNSIVQSALTTIRAGTVRTAEEVYIAVAEILVQSYSAIFRAFHIEPPETPETHTLSGLLDEYLAFFRLFDLVLVYFFVGAGIALVVLGIQITISRGKHFRDEADGPTVSRRVNEAILKGQRGFHHKHEDHGKTGDMPSRYGDGDGDGDRLNSTHTLTSPTTSPPYITLTPSGATLHQPQIQSPASTQANLSSAPSHISTPSHDHDLDPDPNKGYHIPHAAPFWTLPNIIRVLSFLICGTGLALVALVETAPDGAGSRFVQSYWVQPTVMITLFFVLVVQLMPFERWMGGEVERIGEEGKGGE